MAMDVLLILFVVVMLALIASLVRGLVRVLKGGPALTRDFIRGGVTLKAIWTGQVPRQDDGSLVETREGMRLSSRNGVRKLVATRSLSRDTY